MFDDYTVPTNTVDCVLPGQLYIADREALTPTLAIVHGIYRVISLGCDLANTELPLSHQLVLYDVEDHQSYNILLYLDLICTFIRAKPDSPVLIHCYAGVSRSASIVLLVLMQVYGYNLRSATELLIAKRPCVRPNDGFLHRIYLAAKIQRKNPFVAHEPAPATLDVVDRYCRLRYFPFARFQKVGGSVRVTWYFDDYHETYEQELLKVFSNVEIRKGTHTFVYDEEDEL